MVGRPLDRAWHPALKTRISYVRARGLHTRVLVAKIWGATGLDPSMACCMYHSKIAEQRY